MLEAIGVRSIDELFRVHSGKVPAAASRFRLPGPLSEAEIIQYFQARAAENSRGLHFLSGRGRLPASALGGD